jgi:ferritin-like metal-binding protein YciE
VAKNDLLVAWLNDAYAMEQSQKEALEHFVKDFKAFPEIQAKLKQHTREVARQAEEMKGCIERLKGKVSIGKLVTGNIVGAIQGMSAARYKDAPVKNMLMWSATEHFEHAVHTALSAGARACGENEIADICERIAQEEKATAEWTERQIPTVVASVMEAQGEQGMAS